MREIGISPRFSRDKFVPLQTKQRYSTRDISGEVSLTLFFRGFVPFLSLADFVSRNKNLQVADLQRLKSCFGELVTATTRISRGAALGNQRLHRVLQLRTPPSEHRRGPSGSELRIDRLKIWTAMKKELTSRWTKTKPLTRQGRGKEEETASVASLFVLKFI